MVFKKAVFAFVIIGLAGCSAKAPKILPADLKAQPELMVSGWAKNDAFLSTLGNETRLTPANWFTKDSALDGVEGVSADKVYADASLDIQLNAEPVIVAVIDSGVDIKHPDLQGRIWTNRGEIADNGIDDDGNGFIDDVNGWNFLGQVNLTTLEVTRESARMRKLKAEREASAQSLSEAEQSYYDEVTSKTASIKANSEKEYFNFTGIRRKMKYQYAILKKLNALTIDFEAVKLADIEAIQSDQAGVNAAKEVFLQLFAQLPPSRSTPSIATLNSRIARFYDMAYAYYSESFDPRKDLLKENTSLFEEKGYGDNKVDFGDISHGTHVAGIIAAVRDNDMGIQGVAHNALIMPVRAVPNGDEYDKDIANAVRYAADNGAKIINMSFGKHYSPDFLKVQEAFEYAASKGVLIFHAAGNDSQDNDLVNHYPIRVKDASTDTQIPGWIEVGASYAFKDSTLPASFSDFGKVNVDFFSPGQNIKSTVPYGTGYDTYSGTSMATPVAAGVAAFFWSQRTGLSAVQVKDALLASVAKYPELSVTPPTPAGGKPFAPVLFESLSRTGGIVNAYNAFTLQF